MVVALDRWDINTKRNINYRSFEPILRLVKVVHTPQCQHWAAWALANLTRTDGMIYHYIYQSHEIDFIAFTTECPSNSFKKQRKQFDRQKKSNKQKKTGFVRLFLEGSLA